MNSKQDPKLTTQEINEIIGCPRCKGSISVKAEEDIVCGQCGEVYPRALGTWRLIPSNYNLSSDLWTTWNNLQENGLISYTEDPKNNLAVGERTDCLEFSEFCRFNGLVLDVGCGPQPWPTYFKFRSEGTKFVGVDPLIQEASIHFTKFIALGEFLPFREDTFDHVVFATSLDHFIDPIPGLTEARRVCRRGGEIDIWIGEKRSDVPRQATSPSWYVALNKPHEAEDLFHFRRLRSNSLRKTFELVGLNILEERLERLDEYRSNIFFRIKIV